MKMTKDYKRFFFINSNQQNFYNMKNRFLILMSFLVITTSLSAQDFLDGASTFSSSKESYFTLMDGTEITAFIADIDRKKGLIEEITIKDADKKKRVLKPAEIKHMYLPPSGWDKLARADRMMGDITKWDDDKSAHATHIKDGYVYFETTEVMIKKNKMTLLLQLVNPGFGSKIKVFFDPYASESASFGVGGFTVAGGDAKSYYVKKGDEVAFKLQKKNYKEEWEHLYSDCPKLKEEYSKDLGWGEFERHVYFYENSCN